MVTQMDNNSSSEETKKTALLLMGIKGGGKRNPYNKGRDRFNMPFSIETSIRPDLNANRIVIGGNNIAIATQYPYPHQIEATFQMLIDNRTPALVIVASSSDMQRKELPDYFSTSGNFGSINTRSSFINEIDLSDGIKTKIYKLELTSNETSIDIPVIHVQNWPDHQTISPKATSNLVSLIETTVAEKKEFYLTRQSRAALDPQKLLPVIHCRAGVGRTGQTIAAMAMKKYPELSLITITKDLRISRNNYMIEKPVQMETLVDMEQKTKN